MRRAAANHRGTVDRKGREYRPLGPFLDRCQIHVYVSAAAKGQRREESARVVLVGHFPELRVPLDPWRAKNLDRSQALALLWDRLVELIDAKIAPAESATRYEAALIAEGLTVPAGPLHRPGLPKAARLILAYREAHPAASQRMIAAAVDCDPARVCQVFRKYGDPALAGAERRAECALNIQRGFSADSAREQVQESGVLPDQNAENRNTVPGPNSAPPLCTSSLLRREDNGAPPSAAGVPRLGQEDPPRPVVAGHVKEKPRAADRGKQLPPGLEVVVDDLRKIIWAVVSIEARKPGTANLWEIEQSVSKPQGDLDRAVTLGYLEHHQAGPGRGVEWWTPRHPQLVALVDLLRGTKRSAAS